MAELVIGIGLFLISLLPTQKPTVVPTPVAADTAPSPAEMQRYVDEATRASNEAQYAVHSLPVAARVTQAREEAHEPELDAYIKAGTSDEIADAQHVCLPRLGARTIRLPPTSR
jgi:hypothetical protein